VTGGWWIAPDEPRRPRRLRRLVLLSGLAVLFATSATAGWAYADPAAFGAAVNGVARLAPTGISPAGAVAPTAGAVAPTGIAPAAAAASGPGGSPAAAASPRAGELASPTPQVAETLTPAPTAVPPAPTASPSAPTASPRPLISTTAVPAPDVSAATAARLDRALARARDALLLPGVEATVIFPDGSTWNGSAGLADVAAGRPVDPSTPFAVASVTKTFTSALILRYVDQGLVKLDDPLARWLPEWPNARKITIRMLLNHTSGIPDFFRNPKLDLALNRDMRRSWTPAEVLASYVPKGAVFPPGKGWAYSNTNYLLLGVVAAQVGGAPWEQLVRSELIEPLGLDTTYVQGVDLPPAVPALAYRIIDGFLGPTPQVRTDGSTVVPFRSVITAAGSAGAIASTSGDLARWARALYGGTGVLSAATRRELLTFVHAYRYGTVTSYGLGASRVSFDGHAAYGHTGALVGTRSAIRYFPKEKVAVAVLFNADTFVGDDVVRILARNIFPKPAPSLSPSASPATSPSPTAAP
jgi:D-alanyl-D-alanine carboxypeptidase